MAKGSKATIPDRRAIIGGLLSLGGYLVARPFLSESDGGVYRWLEIVQDKYTPTKWYVNLYEGSRPGNLENSTLKSHRLEIGEANNFVSDNMPYPARIWFANGEKEQSF